MAWHMSWKADPEVRPLADRHYNRQKVGHPQFAPPGRALVLKSEGAFWITSYPFAKYVRHAWAGAFVCAAFRNESRLVLSSILIRQACAATRWYYGLPALGMITFIDDSKTRKKRDPGRCYRKAGFVEVGRTKEDDLLALQLTPDRFPLEHAPLGATARHKDWAA